MSRGRTITTALALSLLLACSGSKATELDDVIERGEAPDAVDANGSPTAEDPDAPHALGTIVLGESHASGEVSARPIVSVTFVPDAASSKPETRNVAGCELLPSGSATGAPPGGSTKAGFDAGAITISGAISGATTPITLLPPYAYEGDARGAPFSAGAKLEVQAAGAANAGFERFHETFTATTLVQTSPPLAKLPRTSVFGTDALPIAWVAGAHDLWITVSGEGGSLRCKADDAKGRFEIPREVVKTALGKATTLSLAVARERLALTKGHKTKGKLEGATVRPVGWLALSTTSIETASFQCSGAECTGDSTTVCQDCRTTMCKTEFDACTADATCPFLRTCLDGCTDAACRGACFLKWPEPSAKSKNGALYKCQCVVKCAAQCTTECR
jgi:hypothetical protein